MGPEEAFRAELLVATGVQVLGRGPLAPAAVHYLTWWWMRVVIRMETMQAMMRTLLQELVGQNRRTGELKLCS